MHSGALSLSLPGLRRLQMAALAALAALLSTFAMAQPAPSEAESFIRKVADEAFVIIGDDAVAPEERRSRLMAIMNENVAMDYIARLSLGRHSRTHDGMTAEEKSRHAANMAEYQRLFPEYIFNKLYDIVISKFNDAKVDVVGSTPVRKTDVFVHTHIITPGQQPILADWRVRADSTGELKVIDVRAEGISLTITQRDDFASIIGTGGLEPLIEHMRQQIAGAGASGNGGSVSSEAE